MADRSEWNSQVRRGLLELCVLALLEARPSYGYEIVTRLAGVGRLAAGEGTVYPLLRRLRQLGWLATSWRESDAGPPRQYYELTGKGRQHLHHLEGEWIELRTAVDELLAPGDRDPARVALGRSVAVGKRRTGAR
jgi:PadR family transcriptional regulator PadR